MWEVDDLLVTVLKSELLDTTNVLGENVGDFFVKFIALHTVQLHAHAQSQARKRGSVLCVAWLHARLTARAYMDVC